MYDNKKSVNVGATIYNNEASPNIDYKYGPYHSVEEAYEWLGEDNLDAIAVGLTVGIKTGNGIEEYWFKNGTTLADLVKKEPDLSSLNECLGRLELALTNAVSQLSAKIDGVSTQLKNATYIRVERVDPSDNWLEV